MSNQISTATNLQGPDLSGTQDNASKYFNNYFAKDFTIGIQNDALVAFFEKYASNKSAGSALAASVLYTAQAQGIDPIAVLNEFSSLTPGQINAYLAAFLNFNRVPTSSLGIKTQSTVNTLVSRTILL